MFGALQVIGGLILSFGWWPQIKQTVRTKSVKDLNINTFYSMTFGMLLMEIYAISLVVTGVGIPFLITNSIALSINFTMIFLIFKYRKNEIKA